MTFRAPCQSKSNLAGQWALYCTLSGDVIADLAITAFLSILLAQMRSGIKRCVLDLRHIEVTRRHHSHEHNRTDGFITTLILYTINTGLLTWYACSVSILTVDATTPQLTQLDSIIAIGTLITVSRLPRCQRASADDSVSTLQCGRTTSS